MRSPINFKILITDNGDKKGYMVDEIPQFDVLLLDDINQCIFRKVRKNGKVIIGIFPFEQSRYWI